MNEDETKGKSVYLSPVQCPVRTPSAFAATICTTWEAASHGIHWHWHSGNPCGGVWGYWKAKACLICLQMDGVSMDSSSVIQAASLRLKTDDTTNVSAKAGNAWENWKMKGGQCAVRMYCVPMLVVTPLGSPGNRNKDCLPSGAKPTIKPA